MSITTTQWDASEYLNAAIEENDPELLQAALGQSGPRRSTLACLTGPPGG
jgi:DNA-binding phage protein